MSARQDRQQQKGWRNRIVSSGEKPASDYLAHHLNWRVHPRAQQDALEGVLDQVGWVQNVIESARSGELLDGHARVMLALRRGDDTPVPYVQVDVSPEEEALILSTLDPLSAMAAADKEQLDALLRDVDTGSAALQSMLGKLAADSGVTKFDPMAEWEGMPEFEQEDLTPAFAVKVNFRSAEDLRAFAALLGQPLTENTRSVWYPQAEKIDMSSELYRDES